MLIIHGLGRYLAPEVGENPFNKNQFGNSFHRAKKFSELFPEDKFMTKGEIFSIMLRNGVVSDTLLGRVKAEVMLRSTFETDLFGSAYSFKPVSGCLNVFVSERENGRRVRSGDGYVFSQTITSSDY